MGFGFKLYFAGARGGVGGVKLLSGAIGPKVLGGKCKFSGRSWSLKGLEFATLATIGLASSTTHRAPAVLESQGFKDAGLT